MLSDYSEDTDSELLLGFRISPIISILLGSSSDDHPGGEPATTTRYVGAVDVKRAADLYAQGRSLRQIGAELGVHWSTVSERLQSAGVTMRSVGASANPVPTQQILELRDQGLTWNEVATQLGMTVSGVWSRYRRARQSKPPRLGRWQQVLADALEQNLAIGVRAAVADHLGRTPSRAELNAARRAATVSRPWVRQAALPVCCVCVSVFTRLRISTPTP